MEVKIVLVVLSCIFCICNSQRFKSYGSKRLGNYAPPNVNYTKTYYLSIGFKADWMSASSFCQNSGLTLVTLDSPDEIKNFLTLCNANKNLFDPNSWNVAFVGGVSPSPKDKTAWVWFSTGKIFPPPVQWAPGEPNNNAGASENCMSVVYGSDGQFGYNDIICYYIHAQGFNSQFVCQESTLKGKGDVPATSG